MSSAADAVMIVAALKRLESRLDTLVARTPSGGQATEATLAGVIKAEDGAHVSGESGILALAVRNSAGATLTSTDGDRSGIAVDSKGRLMPSDEVTVPVVDPLALNALSNIQGLLESIDATLTVIAGNTANIKPNSGATGLIATLT
jgi:hypothetical protein